MKKRMHSHDDPSLIYNMFTTVDDDLKRSNQGDDNQ